MITDQTGKVTSRRDFLPFGDDLFTPQRTLQLGYAADSIRQRFTGYEKDTESEFDFAQARYYNSKHGRFTSVDPIYESANAKVPQSWNRYNYALNNPTLFIDPYGLSACDPTTDPNCKAVPNRGNKSEHTTGGKVSETYIFFPKSVVFFTIARKLICADSNIFLRSSRQNF